VTGDLQSMRPVQKRCLRRVALLVSVVIATWPSQWAGAQTYLSSLIRIIVPYAAGGSFHESAPRRARMQPIGGKIG
jgi:tripartite-type tricarboxylate transporter receptor subunit TctC